MDAPRGLMPVAEDQLVLAGVEPRPQRGAQAERDGPLAAPDRGQLGERRRDHPQRVRLAVVGQPQAVRDRRRVGVPLGL